MSVFLPLISATTHVKYKTREISIAECTVRTDRSDSADSNVI